MSDAESKTSSYLHAPVAKKIPRPSNSFLIYRKEHAKKYAGLVATELSTKLAMAWKNETPEQHALKFPDYKFTPVKRGTGKRALQIAAKANAFRTASGASGASSIQSKAPVPRKKANTLRPCLSMPEMSAPILTSTRSGRQVSKPQRYTPSVAYYSKRNIYSRCNAISPDYSSSLFFSPNSYESYSLEAPMLPNSCSSSSPVNTAQVNHRSNVESGSDLSDPEDGNDNDYPGSDCYADRVLLHMSQQPGLTSPTRSWVFDSTSPVANQAVFEPLVMEAFEPECLAHHHGPSSSSSSSSSPLWSTPEGSPTTVMMRQLYEQYQQLQHVLPTNHYLYQHQNHQNPVHQYVQPVYVEPSPLYPPFNNDNSNNNNARRMSLDGTLPVLPSQQGEPTDPAIRFSIEMDKLQRDLTSLLPSPVSTPLQHPSMMALPSSSEISSSSCVIEGTYSFVPPVILVQEDIMMSPALSTCSSVSSGAQDAQSYFARALELL
ncbi:hypothetical protein BGZ92_010877 [Podila epicladia]|nr:hypothetical protein BGZ92_010877 [Podila epicladia]